MSTRIREVRVSFIWFERWGDIWSADGSIPMEFLRTPDGYAKEFDATIEDTVKAQFAGKPIPPARLAATGLTPPWPFQKPEYPHFFWLFYLGKYPAQTSGGLAVLKVAPFHTGFPVTVRTQKKSIAVMTDAFIYPHGMGLVLTLRLYFDRAGWPQGGVQTVVAASDVVAACSEYQYQSTWNGVPEPAEKLFALVDTLFNELRRRVLGEGAQMGDRTRFPFTVAAVIRGDTESVHSAPPETGDIHRMLQALCSFSKTWENDKLTSFKEALLRRRSRAPDGHLLYHTSRGRAVWFPASFTETRPFKRSCGCYQRNLTLLHLQAVALLQALAARLDFIGKGAKVPDSLDKIAGNAAEQLSIIYSSTDATYQSSSARAYLDDTPSQKKLVNDTLASYGKPALQYVAWPP